MSNQIGGRGGYAPESSPDSKPEAFSCQQIPQKLTKKKNSTENRRRFSDEQIKLLESIFESETKLEPRKKLQLAGELGLQPRQIAIWFQNRRARWRSKQIEQEYKILRASYENLASCFESLKNERQSLLIQLQKLNQLLGREPSEAKRICEGEEEWTTAIAATDDGNINSDQSQAQEGLENKRRDALQSGDEGYELVNSDDYTDGSLASPDQWYSFDSSGQFDLSGSSSSQWFNFWA